jgi:hypothetical protein
MPQCVICRHGFRMCAQEKRVTWCFQCTDFPCQRLKVFRDVNVLNGISHHKNVITELRYLKRYGVDKWLAKQEKSGHCPDCGKMLYWFSLECPDCHRKIR